VANAQNNLTNAEDSARINPTPGSGANIASAQSRLSGAANRMDAAGDMTLAASNDGDRLSGQMASGQDQFDAVEVILRLAATKPLTDPYVVVAAQFREQDAKPGVVSNWVYAREVEVIDDAPRTVRFKQGGFPPGFELLKYEVHFYDGGREVASSVAERNVALSRAEAHEYLVVDHVARHKNKTIPAILALRALSGEFRAAYGAEQLKQPVYVQVGADGMPGGIFLDQNCIRAMGDPFLASVIGQARFLPALQSGKPVGGVARITINDLAP
jgi:hypothetical protein